MEQLIQFTAQIPVALQVLFTIVLGSIPLIEAEVAAAISTLAGTPVVLAIAAAAVGNFITVLLVVVFAQKIRAWRHRKHGENNRQSKAVRAIHKYGIPTASLAGPLIAGTHIVAFAAAVTGADRKYIMIWQTIAIVAWAVAGGVLVLVGVQLLG